MTGRQEVGQGFFKSFKFEVRNIKLKSQFLKSKFLVYFGRK